MRKLISSIYRKAHFQLRELYQQVPRLDQPRITWEPRESRKFSSKQLLAKYMRDNPTGLETILLGCIRNALGGIYRIEPQMIICGFIADFFIPAFNLVIEADGPLHRDQKAYDHNRDSIMLNKGYRVIRFSEWQLIHEPGNVERLIRERVQILEKRR